MTMCTAARYWTTLSEAKACRLGITANGLTMRVAECGWTANLWLDSPNNLIICTKGQKWDSNYGGKRRKNTICSQGAFATGSPFLNANSKRSVLSRFAELNTTLEIRSGVIGGQRNCILIPSNTSQNWLQNNHSPLRSHGRRYFYETLYDSALWSWNHHATPVRSLHRRASTW